MVANVIIGVFAALLGLVAASFLRLWWIESRRPRVLCLMYHRLAPRAAWSSASGTERIFTLATEEFERQIAWLAESGYTFLSPDEMVEHASGVRVAKDRSVLVTFDDGCLSVRQEALPILRRFNAKATVFVTTNPSSYVFDLGVEGDRRMTDDELQNADSDRLTCESHSVTHRPLSGLSAEEIRFELSESRAELERVLGRKVRFLAIPGNWFDRRVMAIARDVGYAAVWCSRPGMTRVGSHLFGLPRVNIEGNLTLEQFQSAVSSSGVAIRRQISIIKRTPGRLLGPKLWLPLRKNIMRVIPGGYISTRRIVAAGTIIAVLAILGLLVSR